MHHVFFRGNSYFLSWKSSSVANGRALCKVQSRFAKTMSSEGGADKAELDWEELESLDTRAASHCTAASVPGVVAPRIFEVES